MGSNILKNEQGLKRGYLIHELSTGIYSTCRILNKYNIKDEVKKILVNCFVTITV